MNIKSLFRKKETEPHCSAVIVAAGSSIRMGEDKMLLELGGVPVIVRTVRAFQASPLVDEIILVTRNDKLMEYAELREKYELTKVVKVISGGDTRAESCLAGVSEVSKDAKLIAIHDGARPFVSQDTILRTVYAAQSYKAAVPVIPVTDTLKLVENSMVVGSIDREKVVRIQTPQVFHADIIKAALTKSVTAGIPVTDDSSAVEMFGVKTRTVMGDDDNIKLTTYNDLTVAASILGKRGEQL